MKKFLLIVLCLILACPAALAGTTARELLIENQFYTYDDLWENSFFEYDYIYEGTTYSPRMSTTECTDIWFNDGNNIHYIITDNGSVFITWMYIDSDVSTIPVTITDTNGNPLKVNGLCEASVFGNGASNHVGNVTIPSTIVTIDGNPFTHLNGIKSFRVVSDHPTLATIDGVLFEKESRKLIAYPQYHGGTYEVPNGIVEIGPMAFYCCYDSQLASIIFPSSLRIIGEYSFMEALPSSIELPEGLETIGEGAFFRCMLLTDINIPSTVTSIGAKAFDKTHIRTFTIPASVEYIGEAAFGSIEGKTLIVERGSYAAEYAADNGYYYEYVDGDDTSWLDGDYNEEENTEEDDSYEEDDSWLE